MKREQILTAVPSRLNNQELEEYISGVIAERFRLHNRGHIEYGVGYFTDLLHIAVGLMMMVATPIAKPALIIAITQKQWRNFIGKSMRAKINGIAPKC